MVDEFVCYDEPKFGMEMLKFNYTKNSDFIKLLKNISSLTQKPWFDQHHAKWNQKKNPPMTEVLTKHGIGFTFNLNADFINFDL
jgi:hypothetical protein